MKKSYLFLIIIGISLLIVIGVALLSSVPDSISLTTFKKAYNVISQFKDSDVLVIDIYCSEEDSYLVDKENINSCYIVDSIWQEQLNIEIIDIQKNDGNEVFNNKKFYSYSFQFYVTFDTDSYFQLKLENALLVINYQQNEKVELAIGTFSFYKVPNFGSNDLSITRLKGVVNEVNSIKTLVGIYMEIENNSDKIVTINHIKPSDINIDVSYEDSLAIQYNFTSSDSMKEILEYDYDVFKIKTNKTLELAIPPKEKIGYLFPLQYYNNYAINKVGILMEYEINNEIDYFYYDDFTFFQNMTYSKKEISQLVYYTYANH